MARNSNDFSLTPRVETPRSRFDRNFSVKTTVKTGDLVPIKCIEILPGDTVTMDFKELARMLTPKTPVMDNAYLDIWAFFVPQRLMWPESRSNSFETFLGGGNNPENWDEAEDLTIPSLTGYSGSSQWPQGKVTSGTIGQYLGLPTGLDFSTFKGFISCLPFRAYGLIWDYYFRDQNWMEHVCPTSFSAFYMNSSEKDYSPTASPLKVAKYHDYFTSVLPAPQKGGEVMLSFGSEAPVSGYLSDGTYGASFVSGSGSTFELLGSESDPNGQLNVKLSTNFGGDTIMRSGPSSSGGGTVPWMLGKPTAGTSSGDYNGGVNGVSGDAWNFDGGSFNFSDRIPVTGTADLTSVSGFSINDIRLAFQTQKILERLAMGGSRYQEVLKNVFGVDAPDARLQYPEHLGYYHLPLNMDTVVANSSGSADGTNTVFGDMSGYSKTGASGNFFTKSFVEHGYLMLLCAIRTDHTYSQGIPKLFLREKRFDFYWPQLAHIGMTAVFTREINAFLESDISKVHLGECQVFGYQEAWADYRYEPSVVTGLLAPDQDGALGQWTYADDFDHTLASANADFIEETAENVDRTLLVQGTDQFLLDFYFEAKFTRCMPLYGVPGWVDHY